MDDAHDRDAHAPGAERLGMHEPISRRDFINGTLAAGAGVWMGGRAPASPLAPGAADAWTGFGGVGDYARSNGNTYDVMSVAHAIRDGKYERAMAHATDTGETYDLAVVGGGISGLAAAVFFQKRTRRTLSRAGEPSDLRRRGEAQRVPRGRTDGRRASGLGNVPGAEGRRMDRRRLRHDRDGPLTLRVPALERAVARDAARPDAVRPIAELRLLVRPEVRPAPRRVGDRPVGTTARGRTARPTT